MWLKYLCTVHSRKFVRGLYSWAGFYFHGSLVRNLPCEYSVLIRIQHLIMGATNQNKSPDSFTFQAGLKGITRCLWWRSDVVSLLHLMLSVFPGCFSLMSCCAGVCSEGVYSCCSEISVLSLAWIRTRDISLYWIDEGRVKYLTIETINLFTGCCSLPWRSESLSVPFNVGSPS